MAKTTQSPSRSAEYAGQLYDGFCLAEKMNPQFLADINLDSIYTVFDFARIIRATLILLTALGGRLQGISIVC
jgi:hypothetical protein